MTSQQQAVWLPGQFRRLLHHVPDETDVLRFRHLALPWSSCFVPTLAWAGPLPDYPLCPACLAEVSNAWIRNAPSGPEADDNSASGKVAANSLHSADLYQYALLSGVIEKT